MLSFWGARAAVLALLLGGIHTTGTTAAAAGPDRRGTAGHDVVRILDEPFADPGYLRAAGRHHLYATGPGFKVTSSLFARGGYSAPVDSMPTPPSWYGARADGERHLWAPHVFHVGRQPDGTRYVMWFSASRTGRWDCIGVAVSATPRGPFRPLERPLRCTRPGTTAIDPATYVTDGGVRWLLFKRRSRSGRPGEIIAVRVRADGRRIPPGARSRVLVRARLGEPDVEAPDVVRHHDRLWLFVARGNYGHCSYRTEVFTGLSMRDEFTSAGLVDIRRPDGTRFCGPGGAEVVRADDRWFLAFHAWSPADIRKTWVGRLLWEPATGEPVLARAR